MDKNLEFIAEVYVGKGAKTRTFFLSPAHVVSIEEDKPCSLLESKVYRRTGFSAQSLRFPEEAKLGELLNEIMKSQGEDNLK